MSVKLGIYKDMRIMKEQFKIIHKQYLKCVHNFQYFVACPPKINANSIQLYSLLIYISLISLIGLGVFQLQIRTKKTEGDFPGGAVAKTQCSQCKEMRFDPWSKMQIPSAATKIPAQLNKYKNFFFNLRKMRKCGCLVRFAQTITP